MDPATTFSELASPGGLDALVVQIGVYSGIALGVIHAFQRVAEKIPGKRDDEILSDIERFLRIIVDFVAGRHGKSDDPSMIIKTPRVPTEIIKEDK